MLLTVSLGNTNVAYGLFEGAEPVRFGAIAQEAYARLPAAIGDAPVDHIALASVTPDRTARVVELLSETYGRPVAMAGRDLPYALTIDCDAPEKVGADRLLNAVAAYALVGGMVVVADAGTAVTVDLVAANGDFLGGAIAPGPSVMLNAMADATAQLPRLTPEPPTGPLGRNTGHAMRSGAWYAVVGLVETLAQRLAPDAPVLVTGGAGDFVAREMRPAARYVPHLTLRGLAHLANAGLNRA